MKREIVFSLAAVVLAAGVSGCANPEDEETERSTSAGLSSGGATRTVYARCQIWSTGELSDTTYDHAFTVLNGTSRAASGTNVFEILKQLLDLQADCEREASRPVPRIARIAYTFTLSEGRLCNFNADRAVMDCPSGSGKATFVEVIPSRRIVPR